MPDELKDHIRWTYLSGFPVTTIATLIIKGDRINGYVAFLETYVNGVPNRDTMQWLGRGLP